MRLWEIAGWLLLIVGLFVFYQCFAMLVGPEPHIIEAGPLTIIGAVIFRGGIHLLKVGAAVQVCRQLQTSMREARGTVDPRLRSRETSFAVRSGAS